MLTDVAPYSLGIEVYNESDVQDRIGGFFDPLIERNTVVPVSRVSTYFSIVDKQKSILLKIYQGESRYARNNLFLGEIEVPIPAGDAGKEAIDVRFSYDMSGLFDVDVHVLSSNKNLI